jgi:hypothetical protein
MTRATMPAICVIASNLGKGFSARVTWPDGETEDVGYFRNRNEAQLWLVKEAEAWVTAYRNEYAWQVYAAGAINAPRAKEMARSLSSGSLVYESLTPSGRSPFNGVFRIPSVERLDFDRRQIEIVQAPDVNVDLFRFNRRT